AALQGTCTTRCAPDAGLDPRDPPIIMGGAGCSASAPGPSAPLWSLGLAALALILRRRRAPDELPPVAPACNAGASRVLARPHLAPVRRFTCGAFDRRRRRGSRLFWCARAQPFSARSPLSCSAILHSRRTPSSGVARRTSSCPPSGTSR